MTRLRWISGGLLYLYTVLYLSRFDLTGDLGRLIEALSEPSVLMVFSFLGLYPLAYTLYVLRSPSIRHLRVKLALVLSFFLGAFALEWVMLKPLDETLSKPSFHRRIAAWTGLVLTLILFVYGVFFGQFEAYLEAFQTVAFVHIMTLDFVVLTLWTWTLKEPKGLMKWIPLVGLFKASG